MKPPAQHSPKRRVLGEDAIGDHFEQRRWFLWVPVFIALGNTVYFALPSEPDFGWVLGICGGGVLFLVGLQLLLRHVLLSRPIRSVWNALGIWTIFLCLSGSAFLMGVVASKLRVDRLHTPQLSQSYEAVLLQGVVVDVNDVARGSLEHPRLVRRCLMKVPGVPLGVPESPLRIRLQGPYKRLQRVHVGDSITVLADVSPTPIPVSLQGYDASFHLYFQKISGVGKIRELRSVERNGERLLQMTTSERLRQALTRQRIRLTETLHRLLPRASSPLATALITGDKSGITLQMQEDFNRAGISHMLAISGLHMGLVAGLVFLIFSKLLALCPPLAVRFVVKKIAAMLTVPVIFAYLIISGASFSAMRAFLMVSLSMLAIVIDQKPISLRCTAVAASCILLLFPESLFSVGFQLSFAAVTALCWVYETTIPLTLARLASVPLAGRKIPRFLRKSLRFVGYSALTTVVATLATTPLILTVFQRTTLVGIIGNLLAVPFLSLVVVPLALLSVISLLGGGFAPLFTLWGASLSGLNAIASLVARLPGAHLLCPRPPQSGLILLTLSALWIILWQRRKRWLGVAPLLWGLVIFCRPNPPDIWITHRGAILGQRQRDVFLINSPRYGGFHAKVWAQECGIQTVRSMPFDEVNRLRHSLAEIINQLQDWDDVLLVWQKGDTLRVREIPAHQKRRPWREDRW